MFEAKATDQKQLLSTFTTDYDWKSRYQGQCHWSARPWPNLYKIMAGATIFCS